MRALLGAISNNVWGPVNPRVTSAFSLCFVDGLAEVGEHVIYDPAHLLGFFSCTALVYAPTETVDFAVSIANL